MNVFAVSESHFLPIPNNQLIPSLRRVPRASSHSVRNTTTMPAAPRDGDTPEALPQASGSRQAQHLSRALRASAGAHRGLLPLLPRLRVAPAMPARGLLVGVAYA